VDPAKRPGGTHFYPVRPANLAGLALTALANAKPCLAHTGPAFQSPCLSLATTITSFRTQSDLLADTVIPRIACFYRRLSCHANVADRRRAV